MRRRRTTAPNECEYCGDPLDAGEKCHCLDNVKTEPSAKGPVRLFLAEGGNPRCNDNTTMALL